MKFLSELILFSLWGLLSFIVLPVISDIDSKGWQLVFGISWLITLLATLFIFEIKYKEKE